MYFLNQLHLSKETLFAEVVVNSLPQPAAQATASQAATGQAPVTQ
jgi:hypothetical protein